jgi:hypothetical protein
MKCIDISQHLDTCDRHDEAIPNVWVSSRPVGGATPPGPAYRALCTTPSAAPASAATSVEEPNRGSVTVKQVPL